MPAHLVISSVRLLHTTEFVLFHADSPVAVGATTRETPSVQPLMIRLLLSNTGVIFPEPAAASPTRHACGSIVNVSAKREGEKSQHHWISLHPVLVLFPGSARFLPAWLNLLLTGAACSGPITLTKPARTLQRSFSNTNILQSSLSGNMVHDHAWCNA